MMHNFIHLSNETLWMLFLLIDFSITLIGVRFFGKYALYGMIAANVIITNLQVLKIVELFNVTLTLGNIAYGSIFLCTDLLSECYGKEEAKRAVMIGFLVMLMMVVAIEFMLLMQPSPDDFNHDAMMHLFTMSPRIALASIVAYFTAQYHDVWAFDAIKKATSGRALWLRNNLSTMPSQLIDSLIFCLIAFYGVYDYPVLLSILMTTLLLKWLVALFDTPVIYLGRYFLRKYHRGA